MREGADDSGATARVSSYLVAIVFGHYPMHTLRAGTVRELQTLASALDLLQSGSLPELSDVLMQRFKALELSLQDVSWQVAGELEVVGDLRPSLTSLEEQEVARRAAMLRRRLDEVRGKGAGKGAGRGRGSS